MLSGVLWEARRVCLWKVYFHCNLVLSLVKTVIMEKWVRDNGSQKCGLWLSSAGTYCCKGQTVPEHDYGFNEANFELFSVNVRVQRCQMGKVKVKQEKEKEKKTPAFNSVWTIAIIVKLFTSSWFCRLHIVAMVTFFEFAGGCFKFIILRSKHIFLRKQTNTTPATFRLWCVDSVGLAGWNSE